MRYNLGKLQQKSTTMVNLSVTILGNENLHFLNTVRLFQQDRKMPTAFIVK